MISYVGQHMSRTFRKKPQELGHGGTDNLLTECLGTTNRYSTFHSTKYPVLAYKPMADNRLENFSI